MAHHVALPAWVLVTERAALARVTSSLLRPEFCSRCGQPTSRKFIPAEERKRDVCETCGHIHYVNPKIVAGTLPVDHRTVWLVRRAIEPRLGFWTHPAGFMEIGETVEEGAARETREELGMQVEVQKLLGVYSRTRMNTVHIVYLARPLSGPTGGAETLEFASFTPETAPWDRLAFWSTHRALRDWMQMLD